MTRQTIIDRTVHVINQLPEEKAEEISVFADYILKRNEERVISKGIHNLISVGTTFDFLKCEEDIYNEKDLKEIYDEKR